MEDFTDDWAEEIAEVTGESRYQNAKIRIFDESLATLVTPYDIDTGAEAVYTGGDVYTGQARVIGVRWGTSELNTVQNNPNTLKGIRVQVPFNAVGRVRKSAKIFVVECVRNPVLEEFIFAVTSDLQGSMSATRTFEAELDGDVEVDSGS